MGEVEQGPTRVTRKGTSLYGICQTCGEIKEENVSKTCRGCFHESRRGRAFGVIADENCGLTTRGLTEQQRQVFDAIMRDHRCTSETKNEALGMISRATERGELAQELEFWTAPPTGETHKASSLALILAYAPGWIQ